MDMRLGGLSGARGRGLHGLGREVQEGDQGSEGRHRPSQAGR